ncbi:hypothetical protein [Kluyvera georgiana]|uniref:hypothetical protein n=1 Tax=Kluyvera georgiana TaxID=73098 RepID=UPI0013DCF7B4|nr:hypothetical protein [Kluyvera georgiana]
MFGIAATIIFNWLLFKDPKEVTADGVSAITSIGILIIGIFGIHSWLQSKIRDNGFKQSEKIIQYIEESYIVIEPLYSNLTTLCDHWYHFGPLEISKAEKDKMDDIRVNVESYCNKLTMACNILQYWNLKLTEDGKRIFKFIEILRRLAKTDIMIVKITAGAEIKQSVNQKNNDFNELFEILTSILRSNYQDIFTTINNDNN